MKPWTLPLVTLLLCAPLYSQSEPELFSLDDVKLGMPISSVAAGLQKHDFTVKLESAGLLFIYKDGREVGWVIDNGKDKGKVSTVHYTYEPLDFAIALFNAAKLYAKSTLPDRYKEETVGEMTVGTIAFTDNKGENMQFITLSPAGSDGTYRMIIHRPAHSAPSVEFELVR